jgi:hypothetical protein
MQKMSLLCHRSMNLVYLSTLIAERNGVREEEWSNFEFYPDLTEYKLTPYLLHSFSKNSTLRPLKFKSTLEEIMRFLFCGQDV